MTFQSLSRNTVLAAAALLAITGMIHLVEAPEYLSERTFVGVLFILNAIGCAVAIVGVLRGAAWGWWLGALVTAGAFVSFILSRTVGFFGFKEEEWEGLGLVSLVVEGAFVLLTAYAARARRAPRASGARDALGRT